LYPACFSRTKTAILKTTVNSSHHDLLPSNGLRTIPIDNKCSPDNFVLSIDTDFYDLTPLNNPLGEVVAELVLSVPI
jgi:hypothetical protein